MTKKISIGWFYFELFTLSELFSLEIVMVLFSSIGCLLYTNKVRGFIRLLKMATFILLTQPFLMGILQISKIKNERLKSAFSQGLFAILLEILDKYSFFGRI